MNCNQCGAPLAVDSPICPNCHSVNALDLLAVGEFSASPDLSRFTCPNGCGFLRSYTLTSSRYLVLHCEHCKGMSLRHGVVEQMLQTIQEQVNEKNSERIASLAMRRVARYKPVERTCSVCNTPLKSFTFRTELPLQLERCSHGVWLDNGELSILAEWSESGGHLEDQVVPEPPAALPVLAKPPLDRNARKSMQLDFQILSAVAILGSLFLASSVAYGLGRKIAANSMDILAILGLLAAPVWLFPFVWVMHKAMVLDSRVERREAPGYRFPMIVITMITWCGLLFGYPMLAVMAFPVAMIIAFMAGELLNRVLLKDLK